MQFLSDLTKSRKTPLTFLLKHAIIVRKQDDLDDNISKKVDPEGGITVKKTVPFDAFRYWFAEGGFYRERIDGKAQKEESSEVRYRDLYHNAFLECPVGTDATGRFLLQVAAGFIEDLTGEPDLELMREDIEIELPSDRVEQLLHSVPFAVGSEYVTGPWLGVMYARLRDVFAEEIRDYDGSVAYYLSEKSQNLMAPERIFFHLVENKGEEAPFAFLATYGTKTDENRVKHVPLQYALTEFAGNNEKLIELLSCLERVADVSPLIGEFVESGELFHPLRLNVPEAFRFLCDVEAIEKTGVVCRVPNWWKRHAASVSMSISMGDDKPTYLGLETLIGLKPSLMVDGVMLTEDEIRMLLQQAEGLAMIKGKWVVVNHEKLKELLKKVQNLGGEVTLLEALRSGIAVSGDDGEEDDHPLVTNGAWLGKLLTDMRNPSGLKKTKPPVTVKATLRPYQSEGYEWLRYMDKLRFGACLADDMGLGKTVQVLTYLENLRRKNKNAHVLLVVPASLIGNWQKEAEKFTPSMPITVYHGRGAQNMDAEIGSGSNLSFLSVTTYGMTVRMDAFAGIEWDCLILDEAHAIKNPGTKQTRMIKRIPAKMRIAMTGTPIENELGNLWSLFDFLDQGLLGTRQEFKDFTRRLEEHPEGYARLKNMIAPFMLRRVKTDKKIISDLPDKVENVDYVTPSKRQTVLYRKFVANIERRICESEGIERRGIVLAAIQKLKQICNHPDQYLGQEVYDAKESGKFEMLRDLCETIAEKRERVLVFTQFREIIPYLDSFLEKVFGRKGFVLHGGTPVKSRAKIVEAFQGEAYVPYIVISVKAGGTGLNLTKANHVIHFDRWWNPAVENQATDRAFRIGQDKKVMVHKMVCKGTIEEKIDAMIRDKSELASNVIGTSSGENWITEMNDEELMNLLRLDA